MNNVIRHPSYEACEKRDFIRRVGQTIERIGHAEFQRRLIKFSLMQATGEASRPEESHE